MKQEYIPQDQWKDVIGMVGDWIEPFCDLPTVEYRHVMRKVHHQHMLLEDLDAILVQKTHAYNIIRTVILNVPMNNLKDELENKYWLGEPQIQPILPGTLIGYFKISGTYMEPAEEENG